MRAVLLALTLFASFGIQAQTLKPSMKELGELFRDISTAAVASNAGDEIKNKILRLKEPLLEAKGILPKKVDPANENQVDQYKGMISGLLNLEAALETVFNVEPFDKTAAMVILNEMNETKKKGHALFK